MFVCAQRDRRREIRHRQIDQEQERRKKLERERKREKRKVQNLDKIG